VLDSSNFSRGLIADILRGLDVGQIAGARDALQANALLMSGAFDLVVVSREDADPLDGLGFVRAMRRLHDDRLRRLPVIFITSGLTRQLVISGRDAGVDEFLARPISPVAMRQRLEMVVETPRPFVDCAVFIGPCRRRKNPADYHGELRRSGDRQAEEPSTMVDAEDEIAKTPIRVTLSALREACRGLPGLQSTALEEVAIHARDAREIATAQKDHALLSALAAFESYVGFAAPAGQIEDHVIEAALGALDQLSVLPLTYADARSSVAVALGRAMHKKLAA
jgi:DNA-binding response OmpR family regulator